MEAVARVLAWIGEHKAYLFLIAAMVIALSAGLFLCVNIALSAKRRLKTYGKRTNSTNHSSAI